MPPEPTRYRFGPLERRGLVAGWRGGQIGSVAGGLLVAILVLRSRPNVAGALVAVVAVVGAIALACWPISGRTAEEWLPTVSRWTLEGAARGGRRRCSQVPGGGRTVGTGGGRVGRGARGNRVEGPFGQLSILYAVGRHPRPSASGDGRPPSTAPTTGVLHDSRSGTFTAALALRGHSFALLGSAEKEGRIARWAEVLASLAREGTAVHRLQWIAATVPDDGTAVRQHLSQSAALPAGDPARRSYEELLARTGSSACRHEVLLALQVQMKGAGGRAARAAGGGHTGACAVLLGELATLSQRLGDADVVVDGALGPGELAAFVRRAVEANPHTAPMVSGSPPDGQTGPYWPWPMAVEAEWGRLRADGTWHASYWVAEWPRVEVAPDFLGPLLLGPIRRTVSIVMEPLSPSRATRQVEQARTADLADSELRRRGGFLSTARRARESELVVRRETELADGHASYRFSGYVTVTATSPDALREACQATEQAAGQAFLDLRRLFGDQERGFTCTLPLCRGLS